MQKNEIVPFGYDDQLVRTVMIDDAPWFVAKDVCSALGIQNHKDSVAKSLDDDEKGVEKIYSLGGVQETIVINESGLYTLILRSNKPQAKRFRKWVTSEVLPNIRKNGMYDMTGRLNERLERMENALARIERVQNAQSGYAALPLPEDTHADILRFGGKFLEITGKDADFVEANVLFKLFFRHAMTVPINSKKFFEELSYIFPQLRLDSSRKYNPIFRGCIIK